MDASPPTDRDDLDRTAAALRTQVAGARRVTGLTLSALAHRSGLSTAYLSQIEAGAANPTLRTLAQLAAGLGCALGELFGADAAAGAPRTERFEPRFTALPLLATQPGHHGIWDATAPGATTLSVRLVHGSAGDHADITTHPGEEFVVVLAGRCTLRVGGGVRGLGPGESCHLAATDPHAITDTSEDALLLVVLTEQAS